MQIQDPFMRIARQRRSRTEGQSDFEELEATELFCPRCRRAVPVRKRLLLILPDGDHYEYTCALCQTPVGSKIDRSGGYNTRLVS